MTSLKTICAAALLLPLFAALAPAATQNYGDFNGTHFLFKSVTEQSGTDSLPLFGAPLVAGDQLLFNPVGFESISNSAIPSDMTTSTIRTTIKADPNFGVGSISFYETGSYTLIGPPTGDAYASVSAPVTVRIQAIDGQVLNSVITRNANMLFTPSGGTYQMSVDGMATGQVFEGALSIDINQILAELNHAGVATEVEMTWQNMLTTWTTGGASAQIQKDDLGTALVAVQGAYVPEPSGLVLAGLGMLALAGATRRRRR